MSWTQPCCERCWIAREATSEPDGRVSVRQPTRLTQPDLEVCAFCGAPTIMGVYVRADPKTVAFPRVGEP